MGDFSKRITFITVGTYLQAGGKGKQFSLPSKFCSFTLCPTPPPGAGGACLLSWETFF